ncbi:MAG TPA: GTPase ObgE, partial [Actinomycetales bacterium]|nr:GTPase ObgE [Actinomycetales bacterium]
VFDWEPTMASMAEPMVGPRGTDARLQENYRPTRAERRQQYDERRAARAATQDELAAEREAGFWTDPQDEEEDA